MENKQLKLQLGCCLYGCTMQFSGNQRKAKVREKCNSYTVAWAL
uniref:Uncharacterized protein n=1 Tax=Anguilla anguilla TaxID=7936 RepID=A0A0E9UWS7_ANGAN